MGSVDIEKQLNIQRALSIEDAIIRIKDKDKRIKKIVDMFTYYDSINARYFQFFCMELLQNKEDSEDMLRQKIIELENIINKQNQGCDKTIRMMNLSSIIDKLQIKFAYSDKHNLFELPEK